MPQSEENVIALKPRHRWLFRWGLRFIIAAVVLLAAMEAFCRFYLHLGDPPLSMADPDIEYMFKPNQTVNRFGNIIHYNQWSMKSDDFPKTKSNLRELRILVVGDSVVNGGAQTPNDKTATAILQRNLSGNLRRPVIVGNVSAGSWGPPNQLAYLKRFGLFDADIVVLVISAHDYCDAPTFTPLIGINADFPDKPPVLALQEAVTRYLPRYFPILAGVTGDPMPMPDPAQKDIEWCQTSIREMAAIARGGNATFVMLQHPTLTELSQPEAKGHIINYKTAIDAGIPVIDLADSYKDALRIGKNVYRDDIHLNLEGQKVLAVVLEKAIAFGLNPPATAGATRHVAP